MLRDDLAILKDALRRIDLERLLLLEGGKRVLKKERRSEAEAARLADGYRADGLRVAVLREEGRPGLGTDGAHQVPTFTVIASREAATVEEAVEWTRVEVATGGEARVRGRARYRMGRLLGYPECCLEFYEDLDIREDEEAVYSAWRGTRGTVRGTILATGHGEYSVLSHAPCSFACEPSAALAERILDLLRREDEAAWRAAVRVAECALLYAGDHLRFLLEGERDADGAIRYRDVQPAHYLDGAHVTDVSWLRALRRGDRLVRSPDRVEVFRGEHRVSSLDFGESIRPPILLVPGETLSHRRLRVAVFETVSPPARGDLFGHARASLLAGDLKAAGHRVRAYAWAATSRADDIAGLLAVDRPDVLVFVRVAPRDLLDSLRRVLPHATFLLVESGPPHGAPSDLEWVPFGRLSVLRRIETLSVGETGRTAEPALYVPRSEPFYPEVQRAAEAPGLVPATLPREWEVLGRLACPYRRRARSSRAFAGVDLDEASPLSRGCTMCSFRVGPWARVRIEDWLGSICRQIDWVRSFNPAASRFRLVDHHGLEFLPGLLRRLHELRWTGLSLLLDARVDQILRRQDWDCIAEAARAADARLDFTCIGFENFSQPELDRLNKGVTVAQNVAAARLVRSLWERHPDVFVRLHAAAGFVTWTPWTTLDDLRENVRYFRELNFSDFRSGLASLRLRLYPDIPLYALAARDGLLLDERPPDWEEAVGYSPDHPWRFQSQETAAAHALVRRLLAEGEPGRDVEVLDLAVRWMERRSRGPAFVEARPARLAEVEEAEAGAFVRDLLRDEARAEPLVRAVQRVFAAGGPRFVLGATTWCGNLWGWRVGRLLLPGGAGARGAAGLDLVRHAGRDAGLGELPATADAAISRLLSAPAEVSGGITVEVELPAEGPGPVIRVGLLLTAPAEDLVARVMDAVGGTAVDPGRAVTGSRLKFFALEWAFGQPIKARVALATHPGQPALMSLAATSPLGVRLLAGCSEARYEMSLGRPDRGTLLFRVASEADLRHLLGGLESSAVVGALDRLGGPDSGRSGAGIAPVPTWVGVAVSGRHLDLSVGEVRFEGRRAGKPVARQRRTGVRG